MPTVTVKMYKGRNVDQKRAMVKGITEALMSTLSVPASAVRIFIEENAKEDCAIGGELVSDLDKTS